jgi:hypothetical protein
MLTIKNHTNTQTNDSLFNTKQLLSNLGVALELLVHLFLDRWLFEYFKNIGAAPFSLWIQLYGCVTLSVVFVVFFEVYDAAWQQKELQRFFFSIFEVDGHQSILLYYIRLCEWICGTRL